jgi:G3E family GTPase
MEKTTAGLLGALAGLATIGTAQAAPVPPAHEVMHAASYAELLKPIPNAAEILKASDAELLAHANSPARLQQAQYYNSPPPDYHHHHHHHHHHYYPPPPPPPYYHHHHHHHHHQGGVTIVVPGLGAVRTN